MRYGRYYDTKIGRLYLEAEDGAVVRLEKQCKNGRGEDNAEQQAARECEGTVEQLQECGQEALQDCGEEMLRECAVECGQEAEALRLLEQAAAELDEYLEGKREKFDIPVRTKGTPFQEKVWAALCRIPYGETRTYGEIAVEAGSPKGARAVGMACDRNPVMLFIPCHRVVGSTGALVGFGGGLDVKEYLLAMEKGNAS